MKQSQRTKNITSIAASDLISIILLLGISISLFSVVYLTVLSTDVNPTPPVSDIIGSLETNNTIILEHWGAESVDVNSNLIIDIAGERQPINQLDNYIISHHSDTDYWDFGEQIQYPIGFNITGAEIEVYVTDIHSNSIILYSVLQEGLRLAPQGRGAIWHLDEGIASTAYDSSGNRNHGTIYGANWTDATQGVNNTALTFNPTEQDHVFVEDSYSLDLTENISIEAWFNPDQRDFIINQTEFDTAVGFYPNITHLKDSIFGLCYQRSESGGEGILKTLDVDYLGGIQNASINRIVIDDYVQEPKIKALSEQFIMIVFGDSNDDCQIKTYEILSDGTINATIDQLKISDYCNVVKCVHIKDDIYGIACCDDEDAEVITVNISTNGTIRSIINSTQFSINKINDPDIDFIHIHDDLFAVSYVEKDTDIIFTMNITDQGIITAIQPSTEYFPSGSHDPDLLRISDDALAVVYEDDVKNGYIKTYHINDDGSLTFSGFSHEFESEECHDPDIMHLLEESYIIAYEGPLGHIGKLAYLLIDEETLEVQLTSIKIYNNDRGYEPDLFKISEHTFGVVYRIKSPHPGGISTFSYISYYDYPNYVSGIHKKNSYGLYANETKIFGFLNDQTVSFSQQNREWVYVVMTYDGDRIRLYRNATLVSSIDYTASIERTDYDLYIGKNYEGIIDEIRIYETVLTDTDITNRFNALKDIN